jgi:hypothetical protein
MSKLEVDKIDPQSGTALEIGSSGDTITIPSGATLDASNATTTLPANVVTTDGTQTLTNKSIATTQLTGTVSTAQIADDAVTNAKVNASAAINYSKLNLTGNIALADLSATGTKDATTFLRGDNTFAEAGGTNTPNFEIKKTSTQTLSNNTWTKITFQSEAFDSDSAFDLANDKFIVPSGKGGKYFLYCALLWNGDDRGIRKVALRQNGNTVKVLSTTITNASNGASISAGALLDLSVSDYIEIYCLQNSGDPEDVIGDDNGLII